MSETLVGLPYLTTITADGPALDDTVSFFPPAVRLPHESGLPLVWAYNGCCTGTLVVVDRQPFVAAYGLTRQGNLRAHRLAEYGRDRVLDDRWRIDLRTPIGFGFALRWLVDNADRPHLYRLLATDDSGWRKLCWSHFRGATNDDERAALARAVEELLGPLGGEA
jgi:hypothetical protein